MSAGPATADGEVADDDQADDAPAFDADEAEPAYVPTIERVRVPRRPPLIEIPEDLEVDVSDFVGIDRRRGAEPGVHARTGAGPRCGRRRRSERRGGLRERR